MSLWRRWAVAVASVSALVVAPEAGRAGEEKAAGTPEALGFFDGKGLDGWKGTDFSRPGAAKVEGGTLVLAAGRPRTGITRTRKDLPAVDDELSDEAMRRDGDDFFTAATFPVGTSFLTRVNGGGGGHLTGLSRLDGADASENETSRFFQDEDKTLVSVPRPGHLGEDPLADRRQGGRGRRRQRAPCRHPDRDPRQPAAGLRHLGDRRRPPQTSQSGSSPPPRSPPSTPPRSDARR